VSYQDEFTRLVEIVKRLRVECPWDREQTHESLRQSFIEETYEAIEAIDHAHWEELRNELGDVLLHIALQSAIGEEKSEFSLEEVIHHINEKLIRRHPHVFGERLSIDAATQIRNWEKVKLSEGRRSVVDGVPREMPALLQAKRLQEKASKVGFDWKIPDDVWSKVTEELGELREAASRKEEEKTREEFGDLLFSLVNYSRFVGVNPEEALHETSEKFVRRFHYIEEKMAERNLDISRSTLAELDVLWNEAKKIV